MRSSFCVVFLLVLVAAPSVAGVILFQGGFIADNQVQEFQFSIASSQTVTLQTYGYAGGVVGLNTINPGGFDPNLVMYSPATPNTAIPIPPIGCGSFTNQDPVSLDCLDAYSSGVLSAGTYVLALMVNDNQPTAGPFDPFVQDGNPGFTCQETGGSGGFCDVGSGLAEARTGNWALAITGADSAVMLPEPGALSLAAIGSALVAFLARRRRLL